MSDFSFMKTGTRNVDINLNMINYIDSALALLFSNAIEYAGRYVDLGKRNTVTKKDLEYGLKYSAMEFLKNPKINEDIEKVSQQIEEEEEEYSDDDEIEIVDEEDETTHPFSEIKPEILNNYDDILFVKKMNHYYSYWDQWQPNVFFEKCIKNSINALS